MMLPYWLFTAGFLQETNKTVVRRVQACATTG